MQDRSHKLLFLGLTALMSAAAFYGSEAGPTLMIGNDVPPAAVGAVFTPRNEHASFDRTADGTCSGAASEMSPLCRAPSKIVLSRQ
jgi:hypothetical protein